MAIEDRNTFGVLGNGGEEAEGSKVTYFSLTLLGEVTLTYLFCEL